MITTYTPLQRFFRMLQPNGRAIRNLYIFAIMNGLITLSLPLGIQAIINLIQGGEISISWVLLVGVVLLGYFFNGLLQIYQLKITEDLQKDVFTRSAFDFTFRIPRFKLKALTQQYAPELMNRFFDTITIQKGIAKVLIEFSSTTFQIFFGLVLLSLYHSFFFLFSIIFIATVFIVGTYVFNRGLKSSVVESKYKYKVAFWLEEIARTNTTFRLSCGSDLPLKKTDMYVNEYLHSRDKHFKILLRQYYIFIVFKILIAAGFLLLGGILVFNQQMNIGQFVAAEIVVLLLITSSEKLMLSLETVYDLLTSIEKIGEVTDLELENSIIQKHDVAPSEIGLDISIKDIFFRYPDSVENSINGLTLDISAGERVLLTGSNGAGKATLVKLLTLFYEPESGSIIYDQLPINQYDINLLRSWIAECISEDRIFKGTILENLTVGRTVPHERLLSVLENIGLMSFINQLPQSYDTLIGPQGKKLPGSVNQKIILARNLLKNPRLLIVEDIFKNINKVEKIAIFKYILSEYKRSTIIVVSKDVEIKALIQRTIHMDNGIIVPEDNAHFQ